MVSEWIQRGGLLLSVFVLMGLQPARAGAPSLPVVGIEATGRIAEESAAPLRRINLVGEFTVTRTGSTAFSQPVWLHVSGTATGGTDYKALPMLLHIPAGASSVRVPVTAFNDDEREGIETVVAEVSECPPDGLLAPCYGVVIDPRKARDTVFIREDGLTVATVQITRPESGDSFAQGESIVIEATAIHLDSYISSVEFFADGARIGESTIYFFVAPEPGTPIHHQFEWVNAPPGDHVLTVRTQLLDGARVVSPPVRIRVHSEVPGHPPVVAVVSPEEGGVFPAGESIRVEVEARDPDGYVPMMELFADGEKIGEVSVAFFVEPPPNQLQRFEFLWEDAPPGGHVLTARATDNSGHSTDSAPVSIFVGGGGPTVKVVARDAFAVEPRPGRPPNTATFRICRSGPVGSGLVVRYTMAGRAGNGVDYELLTGTAVIAPGSRAADVVVEPLVDGEEERRESVVMILDEDSAYVLGGRRRAVALIADVPWSHPHPGPHCRNVGDGLVHFCFPVPSGETCRVKCSGDLQRWSTLAELVAVDGAVHVVVEAEGRKCWRLEP